MVESAGGSGRGAGGVGGDGDARGIQAEVAGDVEDVMDDEVVIAAQGVGAGQEQGFRAGGKVGRHVGIGEQDMIDVGVIATAVLVNVGDAGAPEVDVTFRLEDGGLDEVGNLEQAVGAAEVEVGERSGNLGVAAAEELVGGLERQVIEAGDLGHGEVEGPSRR